MLRSTSSSPCSRRHAAPLLPHPTASYRSCRCRAHISEGSAPPARVRPSHACLGVRPAITSGPLRGVPSGQRPPTPAPLARASGRQSPSTRSCPARPVGAPTRVWRVPVEVINRRMLRDGRVHRTMASSGVRPGAVSPALSLTAALLRTRAAPLRSHPPHREPGCPAATPGVCTCRPPPPASTTRSSRPARCARCAG